LINFIKNLSSETDCSILYPYKHLFLKVFAKKQPAN